MMVSRPEKRSVPDGSFVTRDGGVVWADDSPSARHRRVRARRRPGTARRPVVVAPAALPPPAGDPYLGPDRIVMVAAAGTDRHSARELLWRFWQLAVAVGLVVVFVLGVASIVRKPQTVNEAAIVKAAADQVGTQVVLPDPEAEGYAMRVARAWFTYSPAGRDQRRALVAELMPGANPDIAWDGASSSTVTDVWVTADYAIGTNREVHVAVLTEGVVRQLIVTVARNPTRLALYPSIDARPAIGAVPRDPAVASDVDTDAQRAATPTVEGFLRAWGSGVPADVAVFTQGLVPPPGPGDLKLASAKWTMPKGGAERDVNVLVRWADNAGRITTSAYRLTLTTDGGRWSVKGFNVAAPDSISFTNPTS